MPNLCYTSSTNPSVTLHGPNVSTALPPIGYASTRKYRVAHRQVQRHRCRPHRYLPPKTVNACSPTPLAVITKPKLPENDFLRFQAVMSPTMRCCSSSIAFQNIWGCPGLSTASSTILASGGLSDSGRRETNINSLCGTRLCLSFFSIWNW